MRKDAYPLAASLLLCATIAEAQSRKPNVVLIMCDDMGYGDLGCYGQRYIRTPNIDSMARAGMRFTQAYAGSPVSAPSRASLMTGQHTGHTLVRGNKEFWPGTPMIRYGNSEDYSRVGQMPYDTGREILPEMMKRAGYRTALFGKWAGGYEGSPSTPDRRGIDEFYGYICQFQAHLYFPNFLNKFSRAAGDTAVTREVLGGNIPYPMYGRDYQKRTQYSADLIHRHALEWLGKQDAEHPFFAVLTYTLPHAELAQPDDSLLEGYKKQFFWDRTWGGSEGSRYNPSDHVHAQFAAMITRLDCYVGEILAKLRERGLEDNTLVIFTSDNGPHEEGGADPQFFGRDGKLRGLKRQCYEGGIRIPFIAYWPGHVAAASTNGHQLAFYDMMPTLRDLIATPKQRRKSAKKSASEDGISFLPTLLGRASQKEHEFLYWEFHETNQMALRMGWWKLLVVNGKPRLYNLQTDLHEDYDVAAAHPDIVSKMVSKLLKEHTPSQDFKVTLPSMP